MGRCGWEKINIPMRGQEMSFYAVSGVEGKGTENSEKEVLALKEV